MSIMIRMVVAVGAALFLNLGAAVSAGDVDGISGASYRLPALPRSPQEVRGVMQDWLQTHWFMSLATIDADGQPHVAGVTFYVEDMTVYFKTDAASTKAINIQREPRVSYTVWDKVDDMKELRALQVVGRAEILAGDERAPFWMARREPPGPISNNFSAPRASKTRMPARSSMPTGKWSSESSPSGRGSTIIPFRWGAATCTCSTSRNRAHPVCTDPVRLAARRAKGCQRDNHPVRSANQARAR